MHVADMFTLHLFKFSVSVHVTRQNNMLALQLALFKL